MWNCNFYYNLFRSSNVKISKFNSLVDSFVKSIISKKKEIEIEEFEDNEQNNNNEGMIELKEELNTGDDTPNSDTEKGTPFGDTPGNPTPDRDPEEKEMEKKFAPSNKKMKKELERANRIGQIWRSKVMRFLTYCINGGLTDYMLTFESFIQFYNKCQSTNNDLGDFIYQCMDIIDMENNLVDENYKINVMVGSLNEKSKIFFNDDAVAICIKSGFLAKYLSETMHHCPHFIKILINGYCTNKILSKTNLIIFRCCIGIYEITRRSGW
jgi:hypothetical protein